ncbi:MAG: hypothetical protein DRQ51_09445 [Gammaproteobacteria bacterium]|nr:MAG: hypothetical protein DRQ51_09445 [Gammaproteobacteria bacterium]
MKIHKIIFITTLSIAINQTAMAENSYLERKNSNLEIFIEKPIITKDEIKILQETRQIDENKNLKQVLGSSSNVSSAGTSVSGVSIQGTPKRFNSIYWNGIELTDPSAIGLYNPSFSYFTINPQSQIIINSESTSILKGAGTTGSVDIKNKIKHSYISTAIGNNDYKESSAGIYNNQDSMEAAITITKSQIDNLSAISNKEDEFDKDSERDKTESFKTTFNFAKIWNKYNKTNIDYLKSNSKEEYDSTFPYNNPDDKTLWADRKFSAGGISHSFFYNNAFRQTNLKTNQVKSFTENTAIFSNDIQSNVVTNEINHTEPFGNNFSIYLGVREKKEHVIIDTQINKEKSNFAKIGGFIWDDGSLKISATTKSNEFKNKKETTYSKDDAYFIKKTINFGIEQEFSPFYSQSDTTKAPQLLYIYNPYGVANYDLKAERVLQKNYGLLYKNPVFEANLTVFDKKITNYIDWQTINPITFQGQYQNINEATIEGNTFFITTRLPFLSENHSLNYSITKINKAEDKQGMRLTENPNHITTASYSFIKIKDQEFKLNYRRQKGQLAAGSTVNNLTEIKDYSLINASYTYYWNDNFKTDFTVENIKDKFYEKTKNYQGNPRQTKIQATLTF